MRIIFSEELKDIDDGALEDLILKSIDRAKQYGVENEEDVEKFMAYVIKYGFGFDKTHSWAQKALSDPQKDGTDKINELEIHSPI